MRVRAARDSFGDVETLGEFDTHEAALGWLAKYPREKYWSDFRIDEYVEGVWQHRPTRPPERRILKPSKP